ncbi:MAG: tRNA (adenosine(37)-N6)-threonylcarbamoyltransferase complex dimerization subunit type 1 TsaB [Verrucomicrobiota bacterium]
MKILALDFSSAQRSAAVWNGDNAMVCEAIDLSPGRDMKPFALIEAALRQAGLEREAIECIAVGIGPGSYAGIRVAISLAQGWQLATGVKLVGISSVAVIASQAVADGLSGKFNVAIDAQRGEFYLAGYEGSGGSARETALLKLATPAEVEERRKAGEFLVGPEIVRWFPEGRVVYPHAATLARLAAARTDFLSGEKLEPIYLRETTFVKAPPARSLPFAL